MRTRMLVAALLMMASLPGLAAPAGAEQVPIVVPYPFPPMPGTIYGGGIGFERNGYRFWVDVFGLPVDADCRGVVDIGQRVATVSFGCKPWAKVPPKSFAPLSLRARVSRAGERIDRCTDVTRRGERLAVSCDLNLWPAGVGG